MPEVVYLQLIMLSIVLQDAKFWQYESKFDGYCILTFVDSGKVRFITRNKDWTKKCLK